jgi:hypothetical protein
MSNPFDSLPDELVKMLYGLLDPFNVGLLSLVDNRVRRLCPTTPMSFADYHTICWLTQNTCPLQHIYLIRVLNLLGPYKITLRPIVNRYASQFANLIKGKTVQQIKELCDAQILT